MQLIINSKTAPLGTFLINSKLIILYINTPLYCTHRCKTILYINFCCIKLWKFRSIENGRSSTFKLATERQKNAVSYAAYMDFFQHSDIICWKTVFFFLYLFCIPILMRKIIHLYRCKLKKVVSSKDNANLPLLGHTEKNASQCVLFRLFTYTICVFFYNDFNAINYHFFLTISRSKYQKTQ